MGRADSTRHGGSTAGPVIAVPTPRNEAGMPLGGIGAGKVEFCPDGRFTNATINNNLDCPITDGVARTPMMPRVIEGFDGSVYENSVRRQSIVSAEGIPGAWLAVHTPQTGARLLKTTGRPAFDAIDAGAISYEGRFPVATVDYAGLGDLGLRLEAFSSFDLLDEQADYRHSSLPLALFAFEATNRGATPLPVTLVSSWQNLNGIGGYAGTPINRPDRTPPSFRGEGFGPGLWFDHRDDADVDPRTLGDYSLRAWSDAAGAEVTHHAGWDPGRDGDDVWEPLARLGRLANATGPGRAGALAVSLDLAAGQSATVVFAVAWNMPHLLAAEVRWDHLVRPSSAPPPPTGVDRRDYGHAYQNWFADSWATAEHGLRSWREIRSRVARWQSALSESSLPDRMALALPNDLCAYLSATWYTREGLYAMNEAPTDMNGCMGTLDQRGAGCAAVATIFPGLDRSELGLFARDQIRADGDPRRFGTHWDIRTGRFELALDRAGAILHDVGWDHLEGGRLGDAKWTSAHWPELTSLFVLQTYQHAFLTGDRDWLDRVYPQLQAALRFQDRLDQDGDGVADLWGPASCTYDTELYPYYGASAYVTGLYLAALAVMRRVAGERGDADFHEWVDRRFERARRVMEEELWDEERGYYRCWRSDAAVDAPAPASSNSHVSQLAGAWWADLLDLPPIVSPARRRLAMGAVYRQNVQPVQGCPADEATPDGTTMQSMAALAVAYYGANAIAAGLPDLGWTAIERIYRVRYELDGCPWDSPLQWSGPGNEQPQWGRWYMSNPSSWYLPIALAGVRFDRLHNRLTLAPSWPSSWPDELDLPIFLPGLQARVRASRADGREQVSFHVERLLGEAIAIEEVVVREPFRFSGGDIHVDGPGEGALRIDSTAGTYRIIGPISLSRAGDGVVISSGPARPAGSRSSSGSRSSTTVAES